MAEGPGPATACTPPTVSAVVVNHNGGERLLGALAALDAQAVPLDSIVVVDNGSDDGSPERVAARFPRVELLRLGANRGLPAARNVGLGHVRSDLALLIDSDVYVEPECVARLIVALREHGAAVACPRVRLLPDRAVVQADGADAHFTGTMVLRHGYRPVDGLPSEAAEVGGCIGACMLVDRRRVLEAGGFDEAYFFYLEDLEFSVRMRALGHRFICEPAAEAYHDRGTGTPGLSFRGAGTYPARRYYLTARHRLLTLFVHYRLRTLVVLAPALAAYELASLALAVGRGWVGPWARAWWWQIRHFDLIRSRRVRVQRLRVRRDRELLVGGPLPLAPGLVRSRPVGAAIALLSGALDLYWKAARPLIG